MSAGLSASLARLKPHGEVEAVVEPPVLLGPPDRAQEILELTWEVDSINDAEGLSFLHFSPDPTVDATQIDR
jgi:hypothetical protein